MAQAKILTDRDFERLLLTIRKTRHPRRNRLAVLLTFWSGMRVGEVASLRIKDLVNQDGSIKSEIRLSADQTKGHHGRVVHLPEKLREEIQTYFQIEPPGMYDEPVFKSQITGKGFNAETPCPSFKTYLCQGRPGKCEFTQWSTDVHHQSCQSRD